MPPRVTTSIYDGWQLRLLRTARRQKAKEMAEHLGLSPSYVSDIETGREPLTKAIAEQAAAHFGVPIEALRKGATC